MFASLLVEKNLLQFEDVINSLKNDNKLESLYNFDSLMKLLNNAIKLRSSKKS